PNQVTADFPESSQDTAAVLTESLHNMAASVEPRQVPSDFPKPCQVSSYLPSHAEPTLSNPTAFTLSSPAGIPLSSVLPVMAIAILSVWATLCTPEALSDRESAPEASPVHEFVPMPPEVSAYTVEPPKEAASIHELTISSDHESAP
ncbi:hypothetical protein M9458_022855, partial [Cirrhinus mrigala]